MNRYRTLLVCIGYMAVLVLGGVVADRVIANRLVPNPGTFVPAYRSFQEFLAGQKLKQVSDEGGFEDVFVGNSRTLFGVDAAAFDAAAARHGKKLHSYNLAMPTVDPRFWSLFFRKYYAERAPKRVFYGITPRDIDERNHTAEPYQAAFEASPGFRNRHRTGIWKWSEEALAQLYTLRGRVEETRHFRKRDLLRPGGQRDALRQYTISGDRGYSIFPPRYTKTPEFLREDRPKYVDRPGDIRLRPGRDRIRALEELDRKVRSKGGCLTFYSLPVLYDPEPWGGLVIRKDFVRFMREFVRTHPDTEFVNVGDEVEESYPIADFGDPDHLNHRGAEKFSRQLADAIAPKLDRACRPR